MARRAQRILIVEDPSAFREQIKAIIERDDGFEVTGEADNRLATLEEIEERPPDLVVMGVSLSDGSGLNLVREIHRARSRIGILVLGAQAQLRTAAHGLRAGAMGYLARESVETRLLEALHTVGEGRYFLDTVISGSTGSRAGGAGRPMSERALSDPAYLDLSQRERDILRLLAQGFSIEDIAVRLSIVPETVDRHRSLIFRKLGLGSSRELVDYATELGLIDPDSPQV